MILLQQAVAGTEVPEESPDTCQFCLPQAATKLSTLRSVRETELLSSYAKGFGGLLDSVATFGGQNRQDGSALHLRVAKNRV